jgi:hypothetical protein
MNDDERQGRTTTTEEDFDKKLYVELHYDIHSASMESCVIVVLVVTQFKTPYINRFNLGSDFK